MLQHAQEPRELKLVICVNVLYAKMQQEEPTWLCLADIYFMKSAGEKSLLERNQKKQLRAKDELYDEKLYLLCFAHTLPRCFSVVDLFSKAYADPKELYIFDSSRDHELSRR